MAEDFAELGLEGFHKASNKYFDKAYDKIDKPSKSYKENRMNDQQRYPSQPPAHRGYDDDRYNEYDDEEQRGPKQYKDSRGRDRYDPSDWRSQPYGQPRYPKDRAPRYNDTPLPSSSRDNPAPYAAAGAAGGALAAYPKKRYDYDDRRGHSSSRSRSDSRERDRDRDRNRDRPRNRDRDRGRDQDDSRSDKGFRDSPALAFDKSEAGLGAGLAGALVGGWLGHEMGDSHRRRGTALGAIVGGIGANLLEHRWKIYQEEKEEQERAGKEKWERKQQLGAGDGGRRRNRSR